MRPSCSTLDQIFLGRQHSSVNFCGEELVGKSLPSTPTKGIMVGAANAFGLFMLLVRVSITIKPAIMISAIPGSDYKSLHSDRPIIFALLIRKKRVDDSINENGVGSHILFN
jgi:hypothetical protein